jgi:hypothetical protein
MESAMQAAMSMQHERIAAAQLVDMNDDTPSSFSSHPIPSPPPPQLLSRPAIDSHRERAVRSNRDRSLRWRRDLGLEGIERIEASGYIWVVFDNDDGPMRCGKTAKEAMQGVTGTAFLGHVIDDQDIDDSTPGTVVFDILRILGGGHGHQTGLVAGDESLKE